MEHLEASLRDRGWFVKSEVRASSVSQTTFASGTICDFPRFMESTLQVIAEISSRTGHSDVSVIHFELLNLDLRKRGYGILPKDILSQEAGRIKGPAIVQVSEVVDVSRPCYNASKSQDGVLFCSLHDGCINSSAVTLQAETCPLSTQTAPGTKLLIKDATIEQGLIVLDAASIQVRPIAAYAILLRHKEIQERCCRCWADAWTTLQTRGKLNESIQASSA